ncbi:MAG: 3-oxoadipate enol-lactonase, partial [Casimicrobiaceae bacterium]
NGLGTDLSMWEPQVTELSREFRVLRYDTRGHGASATSTGPFGIEHLGRDVLALLDHVGAHHAHFCGLSMGGMIGMWLGIHAPQRLQKLVLAHTAAWIGPQTMWNDRIEVVRAHGMSAISGAAIVRWFTPEFIVRAPGIVAALKASMERTPVDGYIGCCAAIRDADFRNDVARIATPTLVISGTSDIATPPADGRFLASRIGGAESVEFDAAHLSNVELPQDFTAALLRYLGLARASPSMQRTASVS